LTDKAFDTCKHYGITSVQSYVHWSEIEKKPDQFDFTAYDPLVEKLARHNLKWVPFLILGTHYGTPQWFRESEQSVFAQCLEHGRPSYIQSIWNPHLPYFVEKFLTTVADHFKDHRIIESIALGISGNWGESIFPAHGGFGSRFHSHPGWWCGDVYAQDNFREVALETYGTLAAVNQNWGTSFSHPEMILYPEVKSVLKDAYNQAVRLVPAPLKPTLKKLKRLWGARIGRQLQRSRLKNDSVPLDQILQRNTRWLDFTGWYVDSMTNWAEFWLKTARRCFPLQSIYLVTGGEGEPMLGADQCAQTKLAARYGAGIRATNQTDTYTDSFIRTRLIASASRNYGSYFTTEEAGVNCSTGVTMRIFDAVSSGAKGTYFKSLIGTGREECGRTALAPGIPTEGAENLRRHIGLFELGKPTIDIAVLYSQTTIRLLPLTLDGFYNWCARLRNQLDFDLVDETMVSDGLLTNYRYLVLGCGGWLPSKIIKAISEWIQSGGVLVAGRHTSFNTLGGDAGPWNRLFASQQGSGASRLFVGSPNAYFKFIKTVVKQSHSAPPGQFTTCLRDHLLSYDPKTHTISTETLQNKGH
jgi:hypothetical protein